MAWRACSSCSRMKYLALPAIICAWFGNRIVCLELVECLNSHHKKVIFRTKKIDNYKSHFAMSSKCHVDNKKVYKVLQNINKSHLFRID